MKSEGSESLSQVRVVSPEVAEENRAWVHDLSSGGDRRELASRRLHEVLLRAARAEVGRRAARLRLVGPEVDDIAHQAAADALLAICGKVETFRGDCKFTTWAYKFVIFDVAAKVNRHFWQRYGSTAMLSLITAGVSLAIHSHDGYDSYSPADAAVYGAGQVMGQAVAEDLRRNMRIRPTLTVQEGYAFNLMVTQDIVFPGPYPFAVHIAQGQE